MSGTLKNYVELTKPKVTLLNLLVGVTCYVVAAFPAFDLPRLTVFCLVGYMAAGGCGVLNCVYDKDIDKLMNRTSRRVIPSGRVKSFSALVYGALLISSSNVIAYFLLNPMTAAMISVGTLFYLLVYTCWLKRSNKWNVVIGGTAGAFAGLAGWAATGTGFSLVPLFIGLLDFLWTPGHLWGLAIKRVEEYAKVGIPMLPVKEGLSRTSRVIFGFNVATIGVSFLPSLFGLTGFVYLVAAISAGTLLFFESKKLLKTPSQNNGLRIFLVSMPYLASIMTGFMLDTLLNTGFSSTV